MSERHRIKLDVGPARPRVVFECVTDDRGELIRARLRLESHDGRPAGRFERVWDRDQVWNWCGGICGVESVLHPLPPGDPRADARTDAMRASGFDVRKEKRGRTREAAE